MKFQKLKMYGGGPNKLCGFICVYDREGRIKKIKADIERAGATLAHRGPDDSGSYYDENMGMHFRRLSIIDASSKGHQPMMSGDGRFVIVLNGEIYNYRELREELKNIGHVFSGDSDTEVLLKCYEEYGDSCIGRIRGMFAFVVWNRKTKTVTAFRDRIGIKPLYIYEGEQIVMASEIKAILEYDRKAKVLDENSVFKYISRCWVDDSNDTFYKKVKSVPQASMLKVKEGRIEKSVYWALEAGKGRLFGADELRERFEEMVRLHLRSDVPLAATLSGGMDSTSIVAVASRVMENSERLKAFSVMPPDTVDESFWINKVAEKTGIEHLYLDIDWSKMKDTVDEVIRFHDEPFQTSSCIYQYLLRREVSQRGIKVLLVGEGGDEVLGGYRRLFYPYLHSLAEDGRDDLYLEALNGSEEFMGLPGRSVALGLENYRNVLKDGRSGQENISAYALLGDDFVKRHTGIMEAQAYPAAIGEYKNYFFAHLIQHIFIRDIPYVLRMEDRNSMAHGIEARVPLLDHKFMELVFSYDYAEFMKGGINKAMLRKAMMPYLPREVVERKSKSQRPGNDAHIMYKILKDEMGDILGSGKFYGSGYWMKDIKNIFKEDCSRINYERAVVWFRVYNIARWQDMVF